MNGNFTFEVQGWLKAWGTSNSPIRLCRVSTAGWQGVYFNNSQSGSELHWCIVSNSINSGIRVLNRGPYLHYCTLANNSTAGSGGGISVNGNVGSLVLDHCTMTNNTAAVHGGGLAAILSTGTLTLGHCLLTHNAANPAAAVGGFVGGGLYIAGNSVLTNCIVSDNTSSASGSGSLGSGNGVAYGAGFHSEVGRSEIRNCIFRNNGATGYTGYYFGSVAYGGGISVWSGSAWITNSIFGTNVASGTAGQYGGGLYFNSAATGAVANCTFAYNNPNGLTSDNPGVRVLNSILYFNASGGTQLSGPTSVTYSDVQGGFSGIGNINLGPVFGTVKDGLIVQPGSPCIDAGNPSAAYNDVAFNGVALSPSLGSYRNDIGAYGGPGAAEWRMTPVLITSPPPDQIATNALMLSVGAMGTTPMSYQWLLNGAPIVGATARNYVKSPLEVQDEGWYSVVVGNVWGTTNSKPAAKIIIAIPHAATATPIVTNGFLVGITNLWGGWGYTNAPEVRIIDKSGRGAAVQAVVSVSNGMVVALNVSKPGSGYTSSPLLVVAPPLIESPIINIAPLSVLSSTNLAVGTNYQFQYFNGLGWVNSGPSLTATSNTFTLTVSGIANPGSYRLALTPFPTQAYARAILSFGFVIDYEVTSGGSGYTTTPAVTVTGGGGSGATAVAVVSNGVVVDVQPVDPGSGYTTPPRVVIDPPPANALYLSVAHFMELDLAHLSPYDDYQLESSIVPSGSWADLLLFTPTSATSTQRVSALSDLGFYRVRYVGH